MNFDEIRSIRNQMCLEGSFKAFFGLFLKSVENGWYRLAVKDSKLTIQLKLKVAKSLILQISIDMGRAYTSSKDKNQFLEIL